MTQENDRSVITKQHIFDFLDDAAEIGVKGISLVSDGESTFHLFSLTRLKEEEKMVYRWQPPLMVFCLIKIN